MFFGGKICDCITSHLESKIIYGGAKKCNQLYTFLFIRQRSTHKASTLSDLKRTQFQTTNLRWWGPPGDQGHHIYKYNYHLFTITKNDNVIFFCALHLVCKNSTHTAQVQISAGGRQWKKNGISNIYHVLYEWKKKLLIRAIVQLCYEMGLGIEKRCHKMLPSNHRCTASQYNISPSLARGRFIRIWLPETLQKDTSWLSEMQYPPFLLIHDHQSPTSNWSTVNHN